MKEQTTTRHGFVAALVTFLLVAGVWIEASGQSPQNPVPSGQAQAGQATQAQATQTPNVQEELNLTPEQIQKWRAINAELKEEQQAANLRLRQARRALADAVESPTPNEELIKQRAHELADAQYSTTQLQALKESRILQVLSPEQRIKLKEIRQRNQALRRNANQQLPRNGLGQRPEGLQRKANVPPPLGPKQRKLMRQQQRR